jgi:SAM-dependent methyltransferase
VTVKVCPRCRARFSGPWSCRICGWTPAVIDGVITLSAEHAVAGDGFDPRFFERLAELESSSFWFRSRNRLIIWALTRYFPGITDFMEIGCGTGYVLAEIAARAPGMRLVGSELFPQGLRRTIERVRGATFLQMDARDMPFEGEFDAVGAFDVIEHIDDDQLVVKQAFKALRPGGGLLLTVPQHKFLWSAADKHALHKRRYDRRVLLGLMRSAGFEILRCTSFVSLLMPVLIASRVASRRNDHYDPEAEFRLPRFVDGLFHGVMSAELQLIRWGLTFPFGGSLLAVARKPRLEG